MYQGQGRLRPHRTSRPSSYSTPPAFPYAPALPHSLSDALMSPIILILIFSHIAMPYSQSRTPAEFRARGLWAPACAQPLQLALAGLSMGPPPAWIGCCLLTKSPVGRSHQRPDSCTTAESVFYLCLAHTGCTSAMQQSTSRLGELSRGDLGKQLM